LDLDNLIRITHKMFSNSARRTGESPMEFEWQTKNGPVDLNSPFLQFKPPEGQKSEYDKNVTAESQMAELTTSPRTF
jgi:hypothetical protein